MDIGCQSGKWLYLSVNKGAEQPAGVWDHAGVILWLGRRSPSCAVTLQSWG